PLPGAAGSARPTPGTRSGRPARAREASSGCPGRAEPGVRWSRRSVPRVPRIHESAGLAELNPWGRDRFRCLLHGRAPELTTRRVDFRALALAHLDADAVAPQPGYEGGERFLGRALKRQALDLVERDQIDMGASAAQPPG